MIGFPFHIRGLENAEHAPGRDQHPDAVGAERIYVAQELRRGWEWASHYEESDTSFVFLFSITLQVRAE